MYWILFGLVFLFVDISWGIVSITPAFIGYLMLWIGMKKVPDCETFANSRMILLCGIIYSGVTWIVGVLNIHLNGALAIPMSLVGWVLQVVALYRLTQGMVELENASGLSMATMHLQSAWRNLTLGSFGAILLALFNSGVVGLIVLIVTLILYLRAFRYSWSIWERGKSS